jgi:hypothetical protein
MLTLIIIIPIVAITILVIGFFEIRIPFFSNSSDAYYKFKNMRKANKHVRKMMRKKMWGDQIHKGFVKLPTASV